MSAPVETFVTYGNGDELGVVCTHGQLERVCQLCELTAELTAKDKRIAELEKLCPSTADLETGEPLDNTAYTTVGVGYLVRLIAERDALAELVKEMHDWTVGEGDHEFAWDSWLVRARAAIGEKP